MLEDRKGVKVLNVETLLSLPIPSFEEMGGVSKFSTLINRKKSITLALNKLFEEVKIMLERSKVAEKEAISLKGKATEKLSEVIAADHRIADELEQLGRQFNILAKGMQTHGSVLMESFPAQSK